MLKASLPKVNVVGSPVTALSREDQIKVISSWAKERLSRFVCVANVHMLMEAYWHHDLGNVLERADLVTPDGMPLVWMMRLMGARHQDRVAGMDILLGLCETASSEGTSVFFVGSRPEILERMRVRLKAEFPDLQIAEMKPLPFRPLTQLEDAALVKQINESGAGLVLVSLGCPKQEHWMAQHEGQIQAVMVGIGGVFPVYAGIHKRAPQWIRELGFEWLYRLVQEPQRLWGRYRSTIPPFIWLALKQLLMRPTPIRPR
ncbi:MAG: WecB/TagA/CpsF family glycosyltransferase [Cyanothece sp. SIO1E1]|nr:WecB/TagA/CpsF family glycosyltransferase [Cyanothece sp. SIO1E1]